MKAVAKLPGPRTYSLAAAFSAAISYISSAERTARNLSVGCAARKQPDTVPRAQPVWVGYIRLVMRVIVLEGIKGMLGVADYIRQ
jgi:hypothetical protein